MGSLPAGGCPPFSGEGRTCTSLAIVRASAGAEAGALEDECQLWPPHCTLALYGLGVGPFKGIAEQQQGLSPSSLGTCISLAYFLLKVSSNPLHLRRQGRWLRKLLFSFAGGWGEDKVQWNSFSFQLFIHQVYMLNLLCDKLFVINWHDRRERLDLCF